MSEPIRIAYLCLQATQEGQASYAHVREIVRGLARRGVQIAVFEPEYAGTTSPGAVGRALEFWRVQRRLMRESRTADAVYVRAHFAALPVVMWAARRKIPVIQEVNGPYEDLFAAWPWTRRLSRLFTSMMRRQYSSAAALITVTNELATWLSAETGRGGVAVIPNGADTTMFRPEATTSIETPGRYALFFGAFAPWQGIRMMLEAKASPSWPSDVALVFAGDGMERPAVLEAAANDPGIVYLGVVPHKDMPGLIAASVVGLSPQSGMPERCAYGVSPLKLYEMLACGTPVVVTDYPGQAAIVRELDAGVVINPGDSVGLAEAVASVAADPDRAREMGTRGHEGVSAHHTWDDRAERTLAVIRGAVSGGTR